MLHRRVTICAVVACLGCHGSRWAREDADYAAKYPSHTDNVAKMTKQALDARHVNGKRGLYAGFAGRDDPPGAGAEVGLFAYPKNWLELRVGGAMLAHEGEEQLSGGGIAGARVQTPSRIAPFVGASAYVGWAGSRSAEDDFVDNDEDGFTDETGEDEQSFVFAAAPELGVHYWLTSRVRLTGSADYRLTSDGGESDSLYYGVSLAVLSKGQRSPGRGSGGEDDKWSFAASEETYDVPAAAPPQPTRESLTAEDVIHETQSIVNEM